MTNLFEQPADLPPQVEDKNYLVELVGEGKKFQSPEDLARGKYEADQYIEILKKRQDEMREDYLKLRKENEDKAKLEDLIKQMETQRLASSETTQANEDRKPAFDPAELDSLVSNKIQQHELQRRETDNFNTVMSKLRERYGNNYVSILQNKTEELGLSKDDVNTLARKSPKAFFNTLGLEQQQSQDVYSPPPRNQQRSDNSATRGAPKRTWSYYQEMKRKDPKAWLDPKIAVQMQKDAVELGEAFRDGDYFVKGLHEN